MNYYELNNFKSINVKDLIDNFINDITIKVGSISIFGDTIGKPGDRSSLLKSIRNEEDKLIFEFGNDEKITVYNPIYIVINSKIIGIQNCKKVKWIFNDLELEYSVKENLIETMTLKGNHSFRIKPYSEALLFFTW